jgi:hypothetical protein
VADAWFQSSDHLDGLEYLDEDGLWYLDNRVVVPAGAARERVLEEAHDSPYSGHFGKHKVLHQINQNVWWPGWRKDVESYVSVALCVSVTRLRRLRKYGYCNRFLYRALSGKV